MHKMDVSIACCGASSIFCISLPCYPSFCLHILIVRAVWDSAIKGYVFSQRMRNYRFSKGDRYKMAKYVILIDDPLNTFWNSWHIISSLVHLKFFNFKRNWKIYLFLKIILEREKEIIILSYSTLLFYDKNKYIKISKKYIIIFTA